MSIMKAIRFAEERHGEQRRKYEGLPYVSHPFRVAGYLKRFVRSRESEREDLMVAGILHDVVENTDTAIGDIEREFGQAIAALVSDLTSDKTAQKKRGKKYYLAAKMSRMTDPGLTIKLADRFDNVRNLKDAPGPFRDRYSEETDYIIQYIIRCRNLTYVQRNIVGCIQRELEQVRRETAQTGNR